MKAYKLIVTGKVQKVGYRDFVEHIASELGINGYVKNLENKSVELVAGHADESILKQFVERIKKPGGLARVKEIKIEEIALPSYEGFEVIWGEKFDEILESLRAGTRYLSEMTQKQDLTLEKQDRMLEKQDRMLEKQDMALGKQDETVTEIKGVRNDLGTFIRSEFEIMKKEITTIKKELQKVKQKVSA
jgi:acylphosphatase